MLWWVDEDDLQHGLFFLNNGEGHLHLTSHQHPRILLLKVDATCQLWSHYLSIPSSCTSHIVAHCQTTIAVYIYNSAIKCPSFPNLISCVLFCLFQESHCHAVMSDLQLSTECMSIFLSYSQICLIQHLFTRTFIDITPLIERIIRNHLRSSLERPHEWSPSNRPTWLRACSGMTWLRLLRQAHSILSSHSKRHMGLA